MCQPATLFLIVVLALPGAAQNVGIGTTNPSELLEVAGKAKVQQLQVVVGATAGHVLTADALGNATWQPLPPAGGGGLPAGSIDETLRCLGGTSWQATSALVVTSTGHVGAGDPTPNTSYDLTIGPSGFRSDGGVNLITGRLGVGMTSLPSSSYDLDIGTSGFRSSGTDNVITGQLAIGSSSSPSYDLDVAGSAHFDYIGVNVAPSSSYKLYVSGGVRFASMATGTGTPLVITSSGDVRKDSSSRRYKEDIASLAVDVPAVLSLRPVSFRWKPEHGGTSDIGLIAEEVAEILPELVTYEESEGGDPLRPEGVRYQRLPVYLLGVVRAQQAEMESMREQIARLEAEREERLGRERDLEKRLLRLERLLAGDKEE